MSLERQREVFQGVYEENLLSLENYPVDRISGVVDQVISHTFVSAWPEIAKVSLKDSLSNTLMRAYKICDGKWRSVSTFSQEGKLHVALNDNTPFTVVAVPFKPKDYGISPQHAPHAVKTIFNDAPEMLQCGTDTYDELQMKRKRKPQGGSVAPGRERHTNGPARAGSDNNSH